MRYLTVRPYTLAVYQTCVVRIGLSVVRMKRSVVFIPRASRFLGYLGVIYVINLADVTVRSCRLKIRRSKANLTRQRRLIR